MQRDTVGMVRARAPGDGIVPSHRPLGSVGRTWRDLLDVIGREHPEKIARGRAWARGGRVRDLWFAPGSASAEVVEDESHAVTVHVRTFDERAWDAAVVAVRADLRNVAALLEGELSLSLQEVMQRAGVPLMPSPADLSGSCTCDDYAVPCCHVAAVHQVLAEALDGEPFLLFELRGRSRDQVLAGLRRAWGDVDPGRVASTTAEEPPPGGDWSVGPVPPPALSFVFRGGDHDALGLLELGPPPGQVDLRPALRPLYEAGAKAALQVALRTAPEPSEERRRARRRARDGAVDAANPERSNLERLADAATPSEDPEEVGMSPVIEEETAPQGADSQNPEPAQSPEPVDGVLAEQILEHLSRVECAKSTDIAEELGVRMIDVRNELLALEQLGIVYRTGQTRGTRWWLG